MHVLVLGASRGTGLAVVHELLARGHGVTALARTADTIDARPGLRRMAGDATDGVVISAALDGADAVVVTVGISENPLGVRILGARETPDDVRSRATTTIVRALKEKEDTRLVVQSSYGVGPSRDRLPLGQRIVFRLLLAPQIADTERQEDVVRRSGLDWVLVQPVNLTDADEGTAQVSTSGDTVSMRVGRPQVARVLADAAEGRFAPGTTVAVSAGPAEPGGTAPERWVRGRERTVRP